jgi:hypothetical protein
LNENAQCRIDNRVIHAVAYAATVCYEGLARRAWSFVEMMEIPEELYDSALQIVNFRSIALF